LPERRPLDREDAAGAGRRVGQPGAAAGTGAMKTSPELDVKTDR
jgi:hypothetical protein